VRVGNWRDKEAGQARDPASRRRDKMNFARLGSALYEFRNNARPEPIPYISVHADSERVNKLEFAPPVVTRVDDRCVS
jgi:hypothetical protein